MEKSQDLHLFDRKLLKVTGVKTVSEFDEKSVVLELEAGTLVVSGSGMTVSRLDVESGEVEISGTVSGMNYRGAKENLFKRLWK